MTMDDEVDTGQQLEPRGIQDAIDDSICMSKGCEIRVCVVKANEDHGCVDVFPEELTGQVQVDETTFRCPKCYPAQSLPLPYKIQGYAVRQEFIHRNYFPLLSVFLSWSGFNQEYTADVV
ncbi:uncharacterized protein EDB91DRAFT_1079674 [Suillus paluster]|uniref:uncharacterized protein n=1 Tax=Suillus paluster TaxID=48578 RepID=UPI001B86F455|nr:uncharacterized protein EDB91DRAFT_1079674 [Suillus paluster]KAG1747033.1 hypothetical protein EDB91DRAFT_1079674 [Suillus paluster]